MGKLICLMGKSSTGKDTVYRELLKDPVRKLEKIVLYTTRPIREGEKNGREYFFTDEEGFLKRKQEGKVIEDRAYHTCHGLWRYFTVDDGAIDLAHKDYLVIGTPESYLKTAAYFGRDRVIPILLTVDDGVRLLRALERERKQPAPKYQELCRRYLADEEDFSEEKLAAAGIERRFANDHLKECLAQIHQYLDTLEEQKK